MIAAPLASDSKNVPYGSVFCRRDPSTREVISNLYRWPVSTFGTNVSQIPLTPRLFIGCDTASQPLKSPITLTCLALGAQTAKCTPATPSSSLRCAPSFSCARCSVPSLNRCRSYSVSTPSSSLFNVSWGPAPTTYTSQPHGCSASISIVPSATKTDVPPTRTRVISPP